MSTPTPQPQPFSRRLTESLVFLLVLCVFGYLFGPYLVKQWWTQMRWTLAHWVEWCMTMGSLGLGVLLYLLRKHYRFVYGGLEVYTGMWTAFFTAERVKGDLFREGDELGHDMQRGLARLGLLAAVYIIVRGLDNVFVGLEEMKKRAAEAEEKQKRAREEAGPAATGARPTAPTDRGTTEG